MRRSTHDAATLWVLANEDSGAAAVDADELAPHWDHFNDRAKSSWPTLSVPLSWLEFVAERAAGCDELAVWLDAAPATDLYLACACVEAQPAALAIIDQQLLPQVLPALARLGMDASVQDEVRQRVLEQLFVSKAAVAKIAGYSGRSELRSWLRAVVLRTGLKLLRDQRRQLPREEQAFTAMMVSGDDLELLHLRQTYHAEFKAAFETGVASLTPRQRTLLRQHHLDGLNIDKLGALYGVHRATAGRWLNGARAALATSIRSDLRARLDISPSEFESIVRLVRSHVNLTLERILQVAEN